MEENRALDKIKESPSYFFKYSKKFCKTKQTIPSLRLDDKLHNDAETKCKILSDQFKSVWSKPDMTLKCSDLPNIFGTCDECRHEIVHVCKHDTDILVKCLTNAHSM